MDKLQAASTSIRVSGLHQGIILGPIVYVLYTSDLPTFRQTTLGTFADDTAIFATHEDPTIASLNLQEHLNIIVKWLNIWKINVKEFKSWQIRFTLRKGHCPVLKINQTNISQTEVAKYFGCRLNWKEHIANKKKTNQLKNKRDQLVDRKKIPSSYIK